MKVIIVYRPDSKVSVIHPNYSNKKEDETEDVFLERVRLKTNVSDHPFDIVDKTSLPQDRSKRDKWRGEKGKGIKIDESIITLAEKRQALEDELDAELENPSGNPMKALKLQRRLDKGAF